MRAFTTTTATTATALLGTLALTLLTAGVQAWPLGLYYDDTCDLLARSVWLTPLLDQCLVMTNVAGPSFIAVSGTVGDGLPWDAQYELCLYNLKTDCWQNKFVNCFPVGEQNCTRLHGGTHVIKFQAIPKNHTNAMVNQAPDSQT